MAFSVQTRTPSSTNGRFAGIGLCLLASLAAWRVSSLPWNQRTHLSSLILAILAGMFIGNSAGAERLAWLYSGIRFSQQKLLRAGVILYGIRLSLQDLFHLGSRAVALDLTVVVSMLSLGYFLGTRILGLDSDTTLLVSMGSGVCGAAAVLATDRVIDSEASKVSVAVATVVVFGTTAMFLYPVLYPITGFSERQFGIYTGATVHEVAQVVAAGRAISPLVADTAVITKMLRVLLLAPVLFFLGRARGSRRGSERNRVTIPWFVIGFLAIIVMQSVVTVSAGARSSLIDLDTILLGAAMFALGTTTRWKDLLRTGSKPLLLGAMLFGCLSVGGYLMTSLIVR